MPSPLHESLLLLFRNRPALAPELLRDALQLKLPQYSDVRIESAELTDVQPAEYRADMVVLLLRRRPVLGIIVEVQLSRNERKRFVWPAYVANLRARFECPVCLLVVTSKESVARWAAKPIDMGSGYLFVPWVLRPAGVPVIRDPAQARADPELALLSAIAHGRSADSDWAASIASIANTAIEGLDDERWKLYFDLLMTSLSEAARRKLQAMDPAKYQFQSKFARRYVARGRLEGRAELVIRLLTVRFGSVPGEARTRVERASIMELDEIGERLLTALTIDEALGSH
ncbi:MAG: DUF4351 domain-containing protein [Steroidobacteraceae bacterium]